MLALDEVVDALVVDVPKEGTEGFMPLFVVLREGEELTPELTKALATRIREDCSPAPPRPQRSPRDRGDPADAQRQGAEDTVKRILMGQPAEKAASRDSLANPAALDWFVDFAAKQA